MTARSLIPLIKKVSMKTQETKQAVLAPLGTSGQTAVAHNTIKILSEDLYALKPSLSYGDVNDPNTGMSGQKVFMKGLAIRMMVQNYTSQPTVIYRVMVIQLPRGEDVATPQLFEGLHTNKAIDFVDTQRYKVIYSKNFKITHPNQGVYGGESTGIGGEYIETAGGSDERMIQPGQRVFKIWLPVNKTIGYLDYAQRQTIDGNANTLVPKLHHQLVIYPIAPYGTPDGTNVGNIAGIVMKKYFKDG
jgi:hypothetical protein